MYNILVTECVDDNYILSFYPGSYLSYDEIQHL